ncbi:MAG: NAD-dependent epimerase/dehydratase family protein [Actinobacteria bacterium]|nr:MAG: NAD-dependent epimerase/dehydratase family protein [Actinomycetota bacterium]
MLSETPIVLVLGGTGRTGGRVVGQLLARGARVRAIVRSAERLPVGVTHDPSLTVVEAEVLSMADDALRRQVEGCDAVVSCLGHNLSVRGMFGRPRDLVTAAVRRVCRIAEEIRPARPIRLVLMSSVSVNRPDRLDTRRGGGERAVVALLRALIPPAKDNQNAADFLLREVGTSNPYVEWVAVRPDTLVEGDVSDYTLHEGLVASLAKPDKTAMANVAHFMCELTCDSHLWTKWKGELPVIVDVASS